MNSENYRNIIGLFLGLLIFVIIILLPTPQSFILIAQKAYNTVKLSQEVIELAFSTKIVLALLLLMIVWWITEAIPIPATALLPGVLLPIMHVVGVMDGKSF